MTSSPNGWCSLRGTGSRAGGRALRARGLDARTVAASRFAVIGPETGAALASHGLPADVVASPHRAGALVEALAPEVEGASVLFPCGSRARREIAAGLRAAGARLRELEVYTTFSTPPGERTEAALRAGFDAALFHSPSAVEAWSSARLPVAAAIAGCIGETTAEAARRAGWSPVLVARPRSEQGLVEALERHLRNQEKQRQLSTLPELAAAEVDALQEIPVPPGEVAARPLSLAHVS